MKRASATQYEVLTVGRHAWAQCSRCGMLTKLTGILRGRHLCAERQS